MLSKSNIGESPYWLLLIKKEKKKKKNDKKTEQYEKWSEWVVVVVGHWKSTKYELV